MPISTSHKRNSERPGPGGKSSLAASRAARVSAASAPGVPTPRIFPAFPFVVAKVRESNQTIDAGLVSETFKNPLLGVGASESDLAFPQAVKDLAVLL